MKKELKFDGSIFRRYKDLNYKLWYAIAEFVDNSSQSYIDNKKELDASREKNLEIRIGFDNGEQLMVVDNSYGMDEKDIEDLLHVGRNKEASSSGIQRSEFGMGLKTGGFWLGSKIEIQTKKFGCEHTFSFIMDLDKIVSGDSSFEIKSQKIDSKNDSFTRLTIKGMHKRFSSYETGRTKDILSSIYSEDIKNGDMKLKWNEDWIEPYKRTIMSSENSNYIDPDKDGNINEQRWDINIETEAGKKITGFVGLLKKGGKDGSKRVNAGFSVSRNGRNVYCYPEFWRPGSIFGDFGSNNRVNQRVFGHLSFDNSFRVSQTKDLIIFEDDEETEINEKLKEISQEAMNKAEGGEEWWSSEPQSPKLPPTTKEETDEVLGDPANDGVIEEVVEFVTDEVSENDAKAYIEDVTNGDPDEKYPFGENLEVKVWYLENARNADYLYIKNWDMNDIRIVINTLHPYYTKMVSESVNNLALKKQQYVIDCIHDAVSECLLIKKANDQNYKISPHSFRKVKDQFLRKHAHVESVSN